MARPRGKISDKGKQYAIDKGWSSADAKGGVRTGKVRGLTDSDIEGLVIIEDNTERILNAIDTAIVRALEKVGLAAEGYAKRLCPVDTGRLRNSITHTLDNDGNWAMIGTNVEYGKYVELNDRARHANGQAHYLRDAAQNNRDRYRKIIESELRNA